VQALPFQARTFSSPGNVPGEGPHEGIQIFPRAPIAGGGQGFAIREHRKLR